MTPWPSAKRQITELAAKAVRANAVQAPARNQATSIFSESCDAATENFIFLRTEALCS
jgi:hypothetical protein